MKYPELIYGKEDAYGKIESLQEKIDKTEYWDMKILDFQINFLGDEVSMWIYNDADTSWRVSFLSCYKVSYETDATWRGRTVRMYRYR